MKHKTLVRVALVMIVVFGVITVVYPMIFSPKPAVQVVPAAISE